MGHCDSSAPLGGASRFFAPHHGAHRVAAQRAEIEPKPGLVARVLIFLVHCYQALLSPAMASPCKFYPTCSRYAEEALQLHGARRGVWLAAKRLLRCRPFSRGGVDFVPERRTHNVEARGSSLNAGEAGR